MGYHHTHFVKNDPILLGIAVSAPLCFLCCKKGASNSILATSQHCSPQQISDGIKSVCSHCRANPAYFSGIGTRKGGITTAIEVDDPEEILFLQSGHGQTRAARRYMNFTVPADLSRPFKPLIFNCQSFQDLTDGFGWNRYIHKSYLLCSCLVLRSPLSLLLIADVIICAWFPLQTPQIIK